MNVSEWQEQGCLLGKEGRFEEAVMYFDRVIKLDPTNAKAWYNKGLCYKNLKRYSESLACFKRAAQLDPDDPDVERKRKEVLTIVNGGSSTSTASKFPRLTDRANIPQLAVGLICLIIVGLGLWKGGKPPAHPSINERSRNYAPDTSPSPEFVPSSPPKVEPPPTHIPDSLVNGTVLIRQSGPVGEGKLSIDNGTTQDAVVKMVSVEPNRKTYYMVYVEANNRVEVAGVRDGTYELFFGTGVDWDRKKRVFLQDASYSKFDEEFVFKQTRSEDGYGRITIYSSSWNVTLHTVPAGNATKTGVSEQEFNSSDSTEEVRE